MVTWDILARPKDIEGYDIKQLQLFGKYLMTKGTWKLISRREIWKQILTHKYISSTTIEN